MATALVVGMTNLWWMAALTPPLFVEQVVPHGAPHRIPLGIALIAAGLAARIKNHPQITQITQTGELGQRRSSTGALVTSARPRQTQSSLSVASRSGPPRPAMQRGPDSAKSAQSADACSSGAAHLRIGVSNTGGACGIAAPSCRGSDAPKWTPSGAAHHRLAVAERAGPRRRRRAISWPRAFSSSRTRLGHERLDLHVAALERALREAAGFERLLNRHAVVGDVRRRTARAPAPDSSRP